MSTPVQDRPRPPKKEPEKLYRMAVPNEMRCPSESNTLRQNAASVTIIDNNNSSATIRKKPLAPATAWPTAPMSIRLRTTAKTIIETTNFEISLHIVKFLPWPPPPTKKNVAKVCAPALDSPKTAQEFNCEGELTAESDLDARLG